MFPFQNIQICYPELKTQLMGEANRNYLEMAAMGFFGGFQVKMGFCSSQGWAEFSIAIEINNGVSIEQALNKQERAHKKST